MEETSDETISGKAIPDSGLLEARLKYFDDGRSKSFYCLAAALLTIPGLEKSIKNSEKKLEIEGTEAGDLKKRAFILKAYLNDFAASHGIELKLRKKKDVRRNKDGKLRFLLGLELGV